ncbi:MAG: DUF4382 domain-containing protein [Cyclobacteriaceae bacterium]|nr:DUF4382 domain-containing protein [Cyclobacteriaceae bacterium]
MKKFLGLILLSVFWLACSNDDKTARLNVRLTDAPGDYEEVNIDIQSVEIHNSDGNSTEGWKTLNVEKGVYNILELSNGLDTLLATAEVPAGRISQIRLILGSNNSVKVGGITKALSTPSAQQSGLKLNLQADLTEGITYTIILDFDAARSIVEKGNGNYSLKPVIRALEEATSGAIKGTITPIEAMPAVFAIAGTDTVATAYTDEMGKFILRGVPSGSYTVSFNPKEGYAPKQSENVTVTIGSVTDLGTITIQ